MSIDLMLAQNLQHGIALFERLPSAIQNGRTNRVINMLESGSAVVGHYDTGLEGLLNGDALAIRAATGIDNLMKKRITSHAADAIDVLRAALLGESPGSTSTRKAYEAARTTSHAVDQPFFRTSADDPWWMRSSAGAAKLREQEVAQAAKTAQNRRPTKLSEALKARMAQSG